MCATPQWGLLTCDLAQFSRPGNQHFGHERGRNSSAQALAACGESHGLQDASCMPNGLKQNPSKKQGNGILGPRSPGLRYAAMCALDPMGPRPPREPGAQDPNPGQAWAQGPGPGQAWAQGPSPGQSSALAGSGGPGQVPMGTWRALGAPSSPGGPGCPGAPWTPGAHAASPPGEAAGRRPNLN